MDVRRYAWFVTHEVNKYGNPEHPSCASILKGAAAVFAIEAPTPTGTGKAVPEWTEKMWGRTPGLKAASTARRGAYHAAVSQRDR